MPEAPAAIGRLVDDQDVLARAAAGFLELEGEMIGGAEAVNARADDGVFDARRNRHRQLPPADLSAEGEPAELLDETLAIGRIMIHNSKPIANQLLPIRDQCAGQSMPQSQHGSREPAAAVQREDAEAENFGLVPAKSANSITARLRRAIETGVFGDGDQLPPERQLAVAFGTARSTIRKALDQLEQKNLVVRRVGSGTFVNYSGPLQSTAGDVTDLISPLQLIETRMAIEPYMTKLAAIHASEKDLELDRSLPRAAGGGRRRPGPLHALGCGVPSAAGALLAQPAHPAIYQEINTCARTPSGNG